MMSKTFHILFQDDLNILQKGLQSLTPETANPDSTAPDYQSNPFQMSWSLDNGINMNDSLLPKVFYGVDPVTITVRKANVPFRRILLLVEAARAHRSTRDNRSALPLRRVNPDDQTVLYLT
jgi:hypothetical protein